ncbi:GspH/FimT family pseudopilin [Neorhizobium petrolearium]|uniref:Type II secretion system protein H n=1 Tax=Neorhizobium petrolearium TaxID=515361 RepID=A0ABY8MC29_9HYPH|nr:GspH/FimT family pseudopilin [Neorhizobium petrolearium]MCC2613773.1 GspH/FimT family pseudopilin [Neorhizobium petrolearium]WGI72083.1 GspH/FimT family pseudopilin [Neorhizobium petrolearium]
MRCGKQALNAGSEGFSLSEMLVVLAVIGLLFSIAIPSVQGLTKPTPTRVAREVLSMAQLTRLSALKSGTPKALMLDAAARSIRSEAKANAIEIPSTVSFSATVGRDEKTTTDRGNITFFPDGGASGGTLRFGSAENVEAVVSINWLIGIPSLAGAVK